jgi:hypothetical protein
MGEGMKSKVYLLSAVVLLLCLVGWTSYGQKQKSGRDAWEYTVVRANDSSGAEATLNALGAQGWELVSVAEVGTTGETHVRMGSVTYYLKRRK